MEALGYRGGARESRRYQIVRLQLQLLPLQHPHYRYNLTLTKSEVPDKATVKISANSCEHITSDARVRNTVSASRRVCADGGSKIARLRAFAGAGNEEGSQLIEFAICLPLLCLILLGIIAFGITLHNSEEESNAVSVAARLLSSSRGQTTDPCALVANAIEGAAPGLNPASLTLTLTLDGDQYSGTSCQAGAAQLVYGTSAQVTATYPCSLSLVYPGNCNLTAQVSEVVQ
jgi:Flp pilus assembly protein TadG